MGRLLTAPRSRHYPRVSPLAAGLGCRCPRCGKGRLYEGLLSVAERCESCSLDLRKADSGDGPAVFVIFILGALVVPLSLLFGSLVELPYWAHLAIWIPIIVGGAIVLLRPAKALLIALQFHHRASDSGTESYD